MRKNKGENEMKNKMLMALMSTMVMSSIAMGMVVRDDSLEVVYDSDTKLLWQDNSDAVTKKPHVDDVDNYCLNLSFAGHNDWKLPSFAQLLDLRRKKHYLKNISSSYYWASTQEAGGLRYGAESWAVNFGNNSHMDIPNTSIRCVRAGDLFDLSISSQKPIKEAAEIEQKKQQAHYAKLNKFRKNLQEGDETSNGLVVQVKGNLVKIQTNDSQCSQRDYKGNCSNWINTPVEKWIKRSEVYPK